MAAKQQTKGRLRFNDEYVSSQRLLSMAREPINRSIDWDHART